MAITIGKRIKEVREEQGISQADLAERLKYLNQSQVSKIEKGYRKASAEDLVKIAKVLSVPVEILVSGM